METLPSDLLGEVFVLVMPRDTPWEVLDILLLSKSMLRLLTLCDDPIFRVLLRALLLRAWPSAQLSAAQGFSRRAEQVILREALRGGRKRGRDGKANEAPWRGAFIRQMRLMRGSTSSLHNALYGMECARGDVSRAEFRRLLDSHLPFFPNFADSLTCISPLLIEVLRSRCMTHRTLLACIKLLVEDYGCDPEVVAPASGGCMTPLAVCCARGIPMVASYLLKRGARPFITKSSGRFQLWGEPRCLVSANNLFPLEWSEFMIKNEEKRGVAEEHLRPLRECVTLVKKHVDIST